MKRSSHKGEHFVRMSILSFCFMFVLMSAAEAQEADTGKPAPTGLYVKFHVKPGKNAAFEAAFRQMQQGMRENGPPEPQRLIFVSAK